jgi:hypothetical protein
MGTLEGIEFAGWIQNPKKKLLEHQIYQSQQKISKKKLCFVPSKWKEAKNMSGRNLQARPKILKKNWNIKTTNQNRAFSQKKVCLVPQMCTWAKNSYGGYPTEFAGSTQNPKKNIETSKQPIKTEHFPKKKYV